MTAHSTGQAPATGPASAPTAIANHPVVDASQRRPRRPGEPTPRQRWTYSFGRYAVLAIPAFALIAGLLPRSSAAFSIDPTVYAHYLATGQWRPREALATIGLAVTGVLSIVGLASLLFRGRARGYALAGLVAGLTGSAGMLASVGSTVIREDRLRHDFVSLDWSKLAFNADTTGTSSALLAVFGAILLTLGWILLGVAVLRTSGMNRADGPLLMISTPLIFLGGMVLHVLPTMGSFLLLAAGLGIALTAGRISMIGEDTWRQRRRRSALMFTGRAATHASAAGADADAVVSLDRARGLAGSLGLARPQLFAEHADASAAIHDVPLASAAEASEPTGAPSVVPATPDPVAGSTGDAPADNGASNGGTGTGTTPVDTGNAPNGTHPGDDRAPAVKSLRDLLRGARGSAAAWPVYRSRAGTPNAGVAARDDSGQSTNRSRTDHRTGTTGRSNTSGRSNPSGRNSGRSSGRGGRAANSTSGRPAADPTRQPPPGTGTDKPDPSTGSPPARE